MKQPRQTYFLTCLKIISVLISISLIQGFSNPPKISSLNISSEFSLAIQETGDLLADFYSVANQLKNFTRISPNLSPPIACFSLQFGGKVKNAPKTFRIVSVLPLKPKSTVIWPVLGRISSGYGYRLHPITRHRSFHTGIDICAYSGTPVRAPTAGVIEKVGYYSGLGRVVKIRVEHKTILTFAHLSKYHCFVGQKVRQGDLIGAVGSSGRATGPHLHFTVKRMGRLMNPFQYLSSK